VKNNIIDGIWVVCLGVFIYLSALSIDLSSWNEESISPRFVPFLLAFFIIGSGIFLIIQSFVSKKNTSENNKSSVESNEKQASDAPLYDRLKVWFIIILSIVYLLIVEQFGFIITSILYLFFLLRIFYSKKIMKIGVIAVVATFVLFLIFEYVFNIKLPTINF